MRAAGVEGAPLQYRLIYNADYDEQLRSYEVTGTPGSDGDAGGGRLVVRVLGSSGIAVNEMTFSDPLAFARWKRSEAPLGASVRSEEHTSELQSLMRISYAVFCLKKKTIANRQKYYI